MKMHDPSKKLFFHLIILFLLIDKWIRMWKERNRSSWCWLHCKSFHSFIRFNYYSMEANLCVICVAFCVLGVMKLLFRQKALHEASSKMSLTSAKVILFAIRSTLMGKVLIRFDCITVRKSRFFPFALFAPSTLCASFPIFAVWLGTNSTTIVPPKVVENVVFINAITTLTWSWFVFESFKWKLTGCLTGICHNMYVRYLVHSMCTKWAYLRTRTHVTVTVTVAYAGVKEIMDNNRRYFSDMNLYLSS